MGHNLRMAFLEASERREVEAAEEDRSIVTGKSAI